MYREKMSNKISVYHHTPLHYHIELRDAIHQREKQKDGAEKPLSIVLEIV